MNGYVNQHQQAWARYLATLPPKQKCDCGSQLRRQCYGPCYGDLAKGGAPLPAPKGG